MIDGRSLSPGRGQTSGGHLAPEAAAPAPPGLSAALVDAQGRLAAAGVPTPRVDAEILAAHVLGISRGELRAAELIGSLTIDPGAYLPMVERRVRREPLQHITGIAHFRRITLQVGPGVFIPRPETELVAGAAVDEARGLVAAGRSPVVVDLYAGSGAIALSVADEVSGAEVHAVEQDPAALAWLRRNADGSGVTVHHGDSGAVAGPGGSLADLAGVVEVVVANPPYIPTGARIRDPEVAEYDPPAALWSGADGLDDLRALEATAALLLRPGGLAVAEHADLQDDAAPAIFRTTGRWADVVGHVDLTGRPRYVTARLC